MSNRIRNFTYTKDGGEMSERECIEIKGVNKNYLMLDVADLSEDELETLLEALDDVEVYREQRMKEVAGLVKWKTFKPDNIAWK